MLFHGGVERNASFFLRARLRCAVRSLSAHAAHASLVYPGSAVRGLPQRAHAPAASILSRRSLARARLSGLVFM
jgi:hypothetical protein